MTGDRPARRYPASAFPEIERIRLAPIGADAALVNLSASGILVECASRSAPGTALTIEFKGTFSPEFVESRVVRCEVAGISPDGSLRYLLGLAFTGRLDLAHDAQVVQEAGVRASADPVSLPADLPSAPAVRPEAPVEPQPADLEVAAAAAVAPPLRNRW